MQMDQVVARAKNILMTPEQALTEVKSEAVGASELMKNYVAVVAAIPAVATFIGMIGHMPFFRALFFCAFLYAIGLAGVFIFGKVIDALAPHFNSTKNDLNAFKLAAYCCTPGFIAGVFSINQSLGFLSLLGSLYGIYIFYLGLPVLMETPEDKRLIFAACGTTVAAVVVVVLMKLAIFIALGDYATSTGY